MNYGLMIMKRTRGGDMMITLFQQVILSRYMTTINVMIIFIALVVFIIKI